jgi:hypothetical protein
MKRILILAFVSLAFQMACDRGISAPDGEMRVTKTELVADHDLQSDPQVCWITATGRQGRSHVEYRAVNYDGNCPAIETIVVNHDGTLIKKDDSSFSAGNSSFWSAFVKSERIIQ